MPGRLRRQTSRRASRRLRQPLFLSPSLPLSLSPSLPLSLSLSLFLWLSGSEQFVNASSAPQVRIGTQRLEAQSEDHPPSSTPDPPRASMPPSRRALARCACERRYGRHCHQSDKGFSTIPLQGISFTAAASIVSHSVRASRKCRRTCGSSAYVRVRTTQNPDEDLTRCVCFDIVRCFYGQSPIIQKNKFSKRGAPIPESLFILRSACPSRAQCSQGLDPCLRLDLLDPDRLGRFAAQEQARLCESRTTDLSAARTRLAGSGRDAAAPHFPSRSPPLGRGPARSGVSSKLARGVPRLSLRRGPSKPRRRAPSRPRRPPPASTALLRPGPWRPAAARTTTSPRRSCASRRRERGRRPTESSFAVCCARARTPANRRFGTALHTRRSSIPKRCALGGKCSLERFM